MTGTPAVRQVVTESGPPGSEERRSLWTSLAGVPFAQEWVPAREVRTRVLHAGRRGDPGVLLLGGTGDIAESYAGVLGAFGELFDTYAVDFLGCGHTDGPPVPYDTFLGSAFLADLVDELGLADVSIVAVAVGTWYALRFALEHPARVRSLVLISPSAGPAHVYPIVSPASQAARERAAAAPSFDACREVLLRRIRNHATITDDLVLARLTALLQPGAREAAARQAFFLDRAAHDRNALTADDLARIGCPVLWMLCDPTDQARERLRPNLAAMPGPSAVVEWHGVGAWPHWEAPAQFCSVVLPFLTPTAAPDPDPDPK